MSRVDLDPSLKGERELDTTTSAGAGLLGAVVPGSFGLVPGSLSSSPGEGDSRKEEHNPLESIGVEQSEELVRSMQDPVHTSTGFRNSMKLSWEGSLGTGQSEGPWRPLPR